MRPILIRSLLTYLILAHVSSASIGADTPPNDSTKAVTHTLTVLPSTDTSGLNLGPALQNALGRLFQVVGAVDVQLASAGLNGFSASDIGKFHKALNSELISFAYLEKDRIALFLFDSAHAGEFIVSSETLLDDSGKTNLENKWIEKQLKIAFRHLVYDYTQGKFQALPGTRLDSEKLAEEENDEAERHAALSRKLFRELSAIEDKPFYIGASIGMARFTDTSNATSSVNFGAYAGARLIDQVRLEAGVDLFNYGLLHADARYHLPLPQKYVSFAVSAGVGYIFTNITQNGLANAAVIRKNQLFLGPGFSFEVPLLGASIRGEIRYYFANGNTLFMGTYGLAYSL